MEDKNKLKKDIKDFKDIVILTIPFILIRLFIIVLIGITNFCINNGFLSIGTDTVWFRFLDILDNLSYIFLAIMVGFNSAKVFGINKILGVVIAIIMMNPYYHKSFVTRARIVYPNIDTYKDYHNIKNFWFYSYEIPSIGYEFQIKNILIILLIIIFVYMFRDLKNFFYELTLELKFGTKIPKLINTLLVSLVSLVTADFLILATVCLWANPKTVKFRSYKL